MRLAVNSNHDARPTAGYLKLLGDRVREARARRGMTRKILARDSGVSERYLAQLESGQGNISILLLRDIARALDIRLEALVLDGRSRPWTWSTCSEFLRRLPASELAAGPATAGQALWRIRPGHAARPNCFDRSARRRQVNGWHKTGGTT